MSDDRCTAHGKEVLLDGVHLADARDEIAAEAIALALEWAGVSTDNMTSGVKAKLGRLLRW